MADSWVTVGDLRRYLEDYADDLVLLVEHEFGCYTDVLAPNAKRYYGRTVSFEEKEMSADHGLEAPVKALLISVGEHWEPSVKDDVDD